MSKTTLRISSIKEEKPDYWMKTIMQYIETYYALKRRSPSIPEIMHGVGMTSLNHVWYYLKKLEKEGYILHPSSGRNRYKGRKIRLTKKRMFI